MEYVYTVSELADILKTNKNDVYELIRSGHLNALRLGRLKVTRFELERFLREYNGKDLSDLNNVTELQTAKEVS